MVVLGGHQNLPCVVRATILRTTVLLTTPVFFTRLLQDRVGHNASLRTRNRTFKKMMVGEIQTIIPCSVKEYLAKQVHVCKVIAIRYLNSKLYNIYKIH